MQTPVTTIPARTTPTLWLVFKGMALYDDFPGKDFDAVPMDCSDAQLDASISNALAREDEDLELNIETVRRRANTFGHAELPARLMMGLRAYVAEATNLESLCLFANRAMQPRLFFEASWPAQVGMPDRFIAAGLAVLLRKQLRMLLEEGCHLGDNKRSG